MAEFVKACALDDVTAGGALRVVIDGVPVAIVRGFDYEPADGSAALLVRAAERDLFR